MKLVKHVLKSAGITLVSVTMSSIAWAHAHLTHTLPADGAIVNVSPETLELGFSEDVQLLKLSLTDADGIAIDIGFAPDAQAKEYFAVAIPAVGEGTFSVAWTILGKDGHRVEDAFTFTLDPDATPAVNAPPPHGEHTTGTRHE